MDKQPANKSVMKKALLLISFALIAILSSNIACTRDDMPVADDQFVEVQKATVIEAVLQKADDNINKEITMLENLNYVIPPAKSEGIDACEPKLSIVTPANSKFPKTLTLDYGTGCTDKEGNFRAGKVVVHITGPYWEKNTVRHAKLIDYRYNDLKIAGDRHEINKGKDDNGYTVFEVKHGDKIWNSAGELLVERDWNRTRTCNRGKDLTTNADDEIWVSGSAKEFIKGKELVKEITTPLYRKLTCQHFQSGVVATFVKKEKVGELNYGNESNACDNIATWTNARGVVKEITLKTWINHFSTKP